jgi:hypothetical protein
MLFADSGALFGRSAEPEGIRGTQDYRLVFNKMATPTLHLKVLYACRRQPPA